MGVARWCRCASPGLEYQAKLLRWRVLDPAAATRILHKNAPDDAILGVTVAKYDSHFSTGSDVTIARDVAVARFPARLPTSACDVTRDCDVTSGSKSGYRILLNGRGKGSATIVVECRVRSGSSLSAVDPLVSESQTRR